MASKRRVALRAVEENVAAAASAGDLIRGISDHSSRGVLVKQDAAWQAQCSRRAHEEENQAPGGSLFVARSHYTSNSLPTVEPDLLAAREERDAALRKMQQAKRAEQAALMSQQQVRYDATQKCVGCIAS